MIRMAKLEDKDIGAKLLSEHVKEFDFSKRWNNNCEDYYKEVLKNLINDGTVIVSENDNEIDGVLVCARVPNFLNPYHTQLHVLVTWVKKDKRGSSIFYRMNKFLDDKFKHLDKVYTKIPGTTNINHNKLGYKKISESYIKESE